MKRILTGIQSTGTPHLGNMFGAIMPAIELSRKDQTPSFFFIADLHALTTQRDAERLRHDTYSVAASWIACGLDIEANVLYRQSRIPEVCELTWYLNCLTPYPMLANSHAFKDKASQLAHVSGGLFTYPVLMAADILLYHATHIPVGKDQQQHLEISRDIAQAFNKQYQPIFTLPEVHLAEGVATITGRDGRKMSKSYNNTITIFCSDKELEKAIMSISTDSTPLASPKNPDACPLFALYQHIAGIEEIEAMKERYLAGGYGYHAAKKELLKATIERFKGERETYMHYMNNLALLEEKLLKGEERARRVAKDTLQEVRRAVGTKTT